MEAAASSILHMKRSALVFTGLFFQFDIFIVHSSLYFLIFPFDFSSDWTTSHSFLLEQRLTVSMSTSSSLLVYTIYWNEVVETELNSFFSCSSSTISSFFGFVGLCVCGRLGIFSEFQFQFQLYYIIFGSVILVSFIPLSLISFFLSDLLDPWMICSIFLFSDQ